MQAAVLSARLRAPATRFAIALVGAGMAASAAAEIFGGGKPTIPDQAVLSVYDKAVLTDKIAIAPVAAGLGPGGRSPSDPDTPGINDDLYRSTYAELQGYVRAIAQVGPRHDVVPNVRLELTDRFNAYTPSENEIVLTTGLYKKITENIAANPEAVEQLLFILSHEYSHVLYDHPGRFAKKDKPAGVGKALATGLTVATALNGMSAKGGGAAVVDHKTIGAIQAAYNLSPLIELEIYRVTYAPYKKDQESLADFAASDLIDRLGRGDPRDASAVLKNFKVYDNSLVAQLKLGLKSLGENLKASMNAFAATIPQTMMQGGSSNLWKQAQRNILAAVARTFGDALLRRFNKDEVHLYYSADRRVDGVRLYSDKFHPRKAEVASTQTLGAWADHIGVARPQQLAVTFDREFGPDEAAGIARGQLLNHDYAGARATLDAAKAKYRTATAAARVEAKPATKSGKGKSGKGKKGGAKAAASPAPVTPVLSSSIRSANFHMIDAETYLFQGDLPSGADAYARAVALPEAPEGAYFSLAATQNLLGRHSDALATLNNAGKRFGERTVIVAKIRHHVSLGEIDAATKLLADCAAYGDLAKRCAEAMPVEQDDKDDDA